MASLMEELYEAVKTLNPQVLVTSKDQVELRDAMASLIEENLGGCEDSKPTGTSNK